MAATLINIALSEMRPAHATFYGEVNERNPVIVAVRKELKEFCGYIEKSNAPDYKREQNEACSRASNWLFDIWNKYELRLPTEFYHDKLIEIGNYLSVQGSHHIALHQCYDRFLISCHKVPLSDGITSAKDCRGSYFSSGKMGSKQTITTCKALLGSFTCRFHIIQKTDPDFVRSDSVERCVKVLKGLQIFMQCIQKYEILYWMLYNCTIVTYQMCRKLMASGNSIKSIEFLIWASMCMESSVPLLTVQYLTWRVTLYSAVCMAYYDSKAGQHAEMFARRSLTKLQELSELEFMSKAPESAISRLIFQQATVKMAAMVFKRTAFESRKKPKGLLRPKMRNNLKEAAQLVWPRTSTEKLISDMFVGSAAQFLAVLEALSDSHRRVFQPQPPAAETELEMLDVYAELFFAGREIVAGGGGTRNQNASGADHSVMAGIRHNKSLIQLAAAGEDGVTLVSVVRFIKLAFCYEQWDTFSTLLDSTLLYIKKTESEFEGESDHKAPELCLALMLVLERVVKTRSHKRIHTTTSAPAHAEDVPPLTQGSIRTAQVNDDLVNLAETVYYCINNPSLFAPIGKDGEPLLDRDMILDACKILWKRCKAVLSKLQNPAQTENNVSQKWIHLLQIIHSSFIWCGIASIDPAMLSEVSLRLALLLESSSNLEGDAQQEDPRGNQSQMSLGSGVSVYHSKTDQLTSACEILSDAIDSLCIGRTLKMSFDGTDVSDSTWMQNSSSSITPGEALIRDLHVELLNAHHRIAFKLLNSTQESKKTAGPPHSSRSSVMTSRSRKISQDYSMKKLNALVGGNMVSNALLHVQRANVMLKESKDARRELEKAASLLRQSEEEEEHLFHMSKIHDEEQANYQQVVPPPPILLARSNTTMIFKPASFISEGTPVAWYRLYGRTAAGSIVKVRLNDYFLEGTGNEVPAGEECMFRVDGLQSNQRYVFAVAAFTADGTLIGGSIGTTGDVIPAHHPMSLLTAWSLVAEVSHSTGVKSVAKQAARVLWDRFICPPEETDTNTWTTDASHDFELTLHRLQNDMLKASSQILLRHVVVSMFIAVEVAVQEDGLFCNKLCDQRPLLPNQIRRLQECEIMLTAMELAGYLNDSSYLLQAATQCYGLLIPIIQSNVYSKPVVQVLTRCHAVLREACLGTRSQRSPFANNSIHHMIASVTYYLSKVSRSWGRSELCLNMIDAGKLLLNPGEQNIQTQAQRQGELGDDPGAATVSQAKKRGVKPVNTVNLSMGHELNALEERLAELTKEKHSADELTGGEDASTVLAYICTARPMMAYKEISKFRRRSRYLEYFVHVMHKALHTGLMEPAIEWSQEVLMWLRRRNEGLSVNYALMSIQNGAIIVQGNDTNKYAAAITNSQETAKKAKEKKKKKKGKPATKGMANEQEELERKALGILEKHFAEVYRNSTKKKRLRRLSSEEMAWRSEFNHLVGLLHFDVFLNKMERRQEFLKGNFQPSKNVSLLDRKLWSLDRCGNIVIQPNTVNKKPYNVKTNMIIEADDDDPGQALLRAAKQAIVALFDMDASAGLQAQISPEEDSVKETVTPRTNSPMSLISTHTIDPQIAPFQNSVIIDTLKVCMLSFRRALVLAHRDQSWSLLQNVSRSLLACVNVALEQSINVGEPVMTMQEFRDITWFPMTLAADFLLDMLVVMQEGKDKDKPVDSYVGNIENERGGTNLWFDSFFDDSHLIDFPAIKTIILRTIEILHFESRWEQLVDLCLRFSSLTHDRFTEVISPIMIHAQHEIARRVREFGGEDIAQFAVNPKGERVNLNNRNYITAYPCVPIVDPERASTVDVGGYIDPAAHDVYGGGRRALALSRVPFDVSSSLLNLHDAINKSRYMSRALIHSRRLLGLYMASQYSKKEVRSTQSSAKQDLRGTSSVGFVDVQSKNQQPFPPDLTQTDFKELDDVEVAPFSHLPTVIESYVKTIELLTSHGESDLVAQANHELGNLHLHVNNFKSAYKSWSNALDQIFGIKNSLRKWQNLVKDSGDVPHTLLSKLGVWGCLLAVVLTCNIGEYTTADVQMKTDCALLASELVMALFRVSLPHPTSLVDYMSYEIFPQLVLHSSSKPRKYMPGATSIFPNVDLFSDQYRCEARKLMSSMHWLCETLVQMQFNLKAFPCLTLYQYLASFVCKDLQRSVQCRCIKLSAVVNIHSFDVAVNDLCVLLFGSKLPHPTDHVYREPEGTIPNINFDLSMSIETLENLKAMEIIASKRLSPTLSILYGPHLTCEITILQARILAALSECIKCMPQRPTMQDLISVSTDSAIELGSQPMPSFGSPNKAFSIKSHVSDDVRSTVSAMSTSSSYRQVKKLFSKRETPVTMPLLKGMLLAVSESLLSAMLNPLIKSGARLTPGELWVAIQCGLALAQIELQRQHSTIAASHALKSLELMQSSEVFDDVTIKKPRKIRSAMKARGMDGEGRKENVDPEPNFDNMEQKYRARLNARLWLQARLQLCEALQSQIVGLGTVRNSMSGEGSNSNQTHLQLYCAEGLVEAEACNDPEMQAMFLLCGSLVDGLSSEETIKMLEDAVGTLDELPQLSDIGTISLVHGTMYIADLQLQGDKWTSNHAVQEFHNAHAIMLLHSMQHGEIIRHSRLHSSTIDTPFKNIYHRDLLIHAHVKLRIGHASYFTLSETSAVEDWQATMEILNQAKVLCEGSAEKDPRLLAEINLELGKVSRALYFMNGCPVSTVERSLQNAIKTSHISDPSIGRSAHLEIAMLGITLNMEETNEMTNESQNLRDIKRIASALHTAHAIAESNQSRSLLPGNTTVTSRSFSEDNKGNLPDFILLDLSSNHKEIPMPVTIEDATIDPVILAVQMESGDFSWIHVLHYRVLLLRKFSLVRVNEEKRPPTVDSDDSSMEDFYGGDSGKQSDQGSQATKTPMFTSYLVTRVDALHNFLNENLPAYSDTCTLPAFDSDASVLLVQWYRVKHKMALLWCRTDSKNCGKLLISPADIARLLAQIKALLQKVEIHFGQTMAPVSKIRSRQIKQRKQSTLPSATPQVPPQLEDDVKQTLTNAALLISPDHDVITTLPFQVTINSIENMVELFTIGCCYAPTDPLYEWLSELLLTCMEQ